MDAGSLRNAVSQFTIPPENMTAEYKLVASRIKTSAFKAHGHYQKGHNRSTRKDIL